MAFALPFALYVVTLAPTVLNDDPAEYQMILPALGIAHPTGYPLYTLLGHLFTRVVSFGDAAWRVNLFSALAAACALFVVYRLLRELQVSPVSAWLAACVLATTAVFWNYATIAQTYPLNWLLMSIVLFRFLAWSRAPSPRNFVALAFVYGLSLTHHSTMLFFGPPLLLGALVVDRRLIVKFKQTVSALLAFAAPLAIYAYIPLRGEALLADPELRQTLFDIPRAVISGLVTPHYLGGFANVILGSFYASSLARGADVDLGSALTAYLALLNQQVTSPGLALIAIGGVALARRARALALVIALTWLLNVLIVVRAAAAYGEGPELFTPTYLLAALCLGVGGDALRQWPQRFKFNLAAVGMCLLVGFLLWQNAPAMLARRNDVSHRAYAIETLNANLPRDSVILGAWSQVTPLHYVQVVEGVRRDVAVIQAPLASPPGRDLMNRALNENRPLYLLDARDTLIAIPYRAASPANPVNATFAHEITLLGYDLITRAGDGAPKLSLFWRAERTPSADYKVFVHVIDAAGAQLEALDRPPVSDYFPTSLWRSQFDFRDEYAMATLAPIDHLEVGLYNAETLKRLALPNGQTVVRILWR